MRHFGWLGVVLAFAACAGDVRDERASGSGGPEGEEPASSAAGDPIAGCAPCVDATCELACPSDPPAAYRCNGNAVPPGDCHTNGSVFGGPDGLYQCYYCD